MSHANEAEKAKQALIRDLNQCTVEPQFQKAFDALRRAAQQGYYGNFTSPLATPQTALRSAALSIGLTNIAKNVEDGKYDE